MNNYIHVRRQTGLDKANGLESTVGAACDCYTNIFFQARRMSRRGK